MSVPRKQDGWRPGTPQDLEAMYQFKKRFRELKMLLELIESGKLDMKVIRGLLPPEIESDAANKGYVDQKDTEVKTYVDDGLAGKAPAGFGLGETVKWIYAPEKLADYIHSGFYSWASGISDAPFNAGSMIVIKRSELYVYQVAFRDDITRVVIAVRKLTNTTWSEWVDYSPSAFAPAGFGLGTTGKVKTIQAVSELDAILQNGWYAIYASTMQYIGGIPFHSVTLEVSLYNGTQGHQTLRFIGNNTVCRRAMSGGAWGEWEFENPPLVVGTEYRTTERYEGKTVYVKTINAGTPADGGYVDYVGGNRVVRHSAILSNLSLPYTTTGSYADRDAIAVTVTSTRITVYCGAGRAGYGTVYATVWYTKE